MSGHSKWANIKRKKGASDAARGKLFTKIGREITVAVKEGGADPNSNSKLRDCIAKARSNNMPNDNIQRLIKKASGEVNTVNYEEITYEGYGPGGVAFIVKTLTDNKNRTAGDVRHAFDKHGGSLGTTGCVSYMFETKGTIVIDGQGLDEEEIMMAALDAGADDIQYDEEGGVFVITSSPSNFSEVRENLEKAQYSILKNDIEMIPVNYVKPAEEVLGRLRKLIEVLDDNDDVQEVFHNGEGVEEEDEE